MKNHIRIAFLFSFFLFMACDSQTNHLKVEKKRILPKVEFENQGTKLPFLELDLATLKNNNVRQDSINSCILHSAYKRVIRHVEYSEKDGFSLNIESGEEVYISNFLFNMAKFMTVDVSNEEFKKYPLDKDVKWIFPDFKNITIVNDFVYAEMFNEVYAAYMKSEHEK